MTTQPMLPCILSRKCPFGRHRRRRSSYSISLTLPIYTIAAWVTWTLQPKDRTGSEGGVVANLYVDVVWARASSTRGLGAIHRLDGHDSMSCCPCLFADFRREIVRSLPVAPGALWVQTVGRSQICAVCDPHFDGHELIVTPQRRMCVLKTCNS